MPDVSNVSDVELQVMIFLYNALEQGWNVKKTNDCYIFNKKHEDKKEFFSDAYLKRFIKDNLATSS